MQLINLLLTAQSLTLKKTPKKEQTTTDYKHYCVKYESKVVLEASAFIDNLSQPTQNLQLHHNSLSAQPQNANVAQEKGRLKNP